MEEYNERRNIMSYQNGTPHYNLPQTIGTDKRDWFDTNEAFAELDSAVYSANNTAQTASEGLAQTNENVGALETRVETAEGNIGTLQRDLDTAEENIGINATAISGLQITVADNKQDLEDMITAYEEETATASASHNVGDYFRYNNVLYITTITIRVGDTIVPDVNCRSTNVMTRVKALESGGGGLTPLASSVLYDNSTSGLTATDVQSAIDEVDGTLDIAVSGVQSNSGHIGDLTLLETTSKSDLVSAINEVLSQIGGGGMPLLDFANPLHTFSSGNLTFTATKECYLLGTLSANAAAGFGNSASVTINSVPTFAFNVTGTGGGNASAVMTIPLTKLRSGDTVVASSEQTLHVYEEVTA